MGESISGEFIIFQLVIIHYSSCMMNGICEGKVEGEKWVRRS
jgi:hypothetical protein